MTESSPRTKGGRLTGAAGPSSPTLQSPLPSSRRLCILPVSLVRNKPFECTAQRKYGEGLAMQAASPQDSDVQKHKRFLCPGCMFLHFCRHDYGTQKGGEGGVRSIAMMILTRPPRGCCNAGMGACLRFDPKVESTPQGGSCKARE